MDNQKFADITFMALTIWREARGESIEGKKGVAFTVINRVSKPSWWGSDIMSVLFKKWQYSSLTDPKDRQLTTWPSADDTSWQESLDVAFKVISGEYTNPVPGADSYFDVSIKAPPWATKNKFVKKIGRLNFYNVDSDFEKTL